MEAWKLLWRARWARIYACCAALHVEWLAFAIRKKSAAHSIFASMWIISSPHPIHIEHQHDRFPFRLLRSLSNDAYRLIHLEPATHCDPLLAYPTAKHQQGISPILDR